MGGLFLSRKYHLDAGYITIPAATKIVLKFLDIKIDDKSHYLKILRGAKKGWFGGKMHGKRMFQVSREEILQYANQLQQTEKYNLFTFEEIQTLQKRTISLEVPEREVDPEPIHSL
jgi:hypothetical protein